MRTIDHRRAMRCCGILATLALTSGSLAGDTRSDAAPTSPRATPIPDLEFLGAPAAPAAAGDPAPIADLWSTCPRVPFESGVTRLARTQRAFSLATADLDADGHPELLVPEFGDVGSLLVVDVRDARLHVRQTLEFEPPLPGIAVVTTGDFTGDGLPDVAVGATGSRVALLRNDGQGTLEHIATLEPDEPVVGTPQGLAILTTGLEPGATAAVVVPGAALEWQFDADGSLVVLRPWISGFFGTVAAIDVDEDGLEDVVLGGVSTGGPEASWARRQADGTWDEPTGLGAATVGAYPDIDVVDVTGDGLDDVVLVRWDPNGDPEDPQIVTLVNDPAGDFAAVVPSGELRTQGTYAWGAVADFDRDGHVDVLTTAGPNTFGDDSDVRLMAGDGTGSFSERFVMSDTRGGGPTAVIDADDDGHLDLITAEPYFFVEGTEATVTLRLNRGNLPGGTIDVRQTGLVAIADVDGADDGRAELLSIDDGALVVSALDAFDQPIELARVAIDPDRTVATDIVTTGLAGVGDGVRAAIALRPEFGTLDRRIVTVRFDGFTPVIAGDVAGFEADQRVTFFDLNGSPSGGLAVVASPEVSTFARTDAGLEPIASFTVPAASVPDDRLGLAVGDLDADGHDDLVVAVVSAGAIFTPVIVAHGDGTGVFADPRQIPDDDSEFAGAPPFIVDFDGDGAVELVRAGDSDAPVRIVRQAPDRRYVIEALPVVLSTAGVDDAPFQAVVADFDGDGALDIAASSRVRPSLRIISSVPGSGVTVRRVPHRATRSDGTFQGPHGAGDLNGDGAIDLAFVDDLGRVAVLRGGLCGPQCPTDLDLDAETGFTDLLAVLGTFGATSADRVPEQADVDENGVVDFIDLLTLLGSWGACPE